MRSRETFGFGMCTVAGVVHIVFTYFLLSAILTSLTIFSAKSNSKNLSREERDLALRQHNHYRSMVSKGNALNKNGKLLPHATNMVRLSYNTSLEAGMTEWLSQCVFAHDERLGKKRYFGENIYELSGSDLSSVTNARALNKAMTAFWMELRDCGFQPHSKKKREISCTKKSGTVLHWTQMVWGRTTSVGCAVRRCPGKILVGCRYFPKGNYNGMRVYRTSKRCKCRQKKCPADGLCDASVMKASPPPKKQKKPTSLLHISIL